MPRKKKVRDPRYEYPDPTPVEMPLGHQTPPTLAEQIKSMIRYEMSEAMDDDGYETWEEADDFDVDEDHGDLDLTSQYDLTDMELDSFYQQADAWHNANKKRVQLDDDKEGDSKPPPPGTAETPVGTQESDSPD